MGLPKDKLPVLEEFVTIQGEGVNIGKPYYFIRVGGCPLRCRFCDSEYTWTMKPESLVSLDSVIDRAIKQCKENGIEWISITGGEPLLYPKQLLKMMAMFYEADISVHIETSGRYYDENVHAACDIYSVDAKTPCTAEMMEGDFLGKENLRSYDQVKCLIETVEDLEYAYRLNQELAGVCTMVLQPFNVSPKQGGWMKPSIDVGVGLRKLLNFFHASQSMGHKWVNVIITPQIHVLAYGNKPGV